MDDEFKSDLRIIDIRDLFQNVEKDSQIRIIVKHYLQLDSPNEFLLNIYNSIKNYEFYVNCNEQYVTTNYNDFSEIELLINGLIKVLLLVKNFVKIDATGKASWIENNLSNEFMISDDKMKGKIHWNNKSMSDIFNRQIKILTKEYNKSKFFIEISRVENVDEGDDDLDLGGV